MNTQYSPYFSSLCVYLHLRCEKTFAQFYQNLDNRGNNICRLVVKGM